MFANIDAEGGAKVKSSMENVISFRKGGGLVCLAGCAIARARLTTTPPQAAETARAQTHAKVRTWKTL
jgi:hypothetical protein